jgi:restriction system protein
MGRSFISIAVQAARAADRAARRHQREQSRLARAAERDLRRMEREEKRRYQEDRAAQTEALNEELLQDIDALENLLIDGIGRDPRVDWQALASASTKVEPDASLDVRPLPALETLVPPPPGMFARLIPGSEARHEREVERAREEHARLAREHASLSQRRGAALERQRKQADELAARVAQLRAGYREGRPEAVSEVFEIVLEDSPLPDAFPRTARVGYTPQSRQLVVDYQLPTMDEIIPENDRYRYNKSSDAIMPTRRAVRTGQNLYARVVAMTVLRCLHEVITADEGAVIDVVAINAFVDTTDPSTGKRIQPYLISVRVTREQFHQLELAHVDALQCLKRLSAFVSRSPAELAPVKPVVDINMVDPRFIEETDVLSTLDTRPNLMELTPGEFESLITNLFEKMGLETRLTQASRDGGVDCVAFDQRPILGGKVIIQAKRYKNTVGVSAVRDLFGAMHNEGASKGILVTTSGYGSAAFEFAEGKPIELLDGSNLLYLLKEHAGIDAKIEVPEGWVDARPDAPAEV